MPRGRGVGGVLSVSQLSSVAREVLADRACSIGRVHSVFEHAFNFVLDDWLLTVADAAGGGLPNGLLVERAPDFQACGVTVGQAVTRGADGTLLRVAGSDIWLDPRLATTWSPAVEARGQRPASIHIPHCTASSARVTLQNPYVTVQTGRVTVQTCRMTVQTGRMTAQTGGVTGVTRRLTGHRCHADVPTSTPARVASAACASRTATTPSAIVTTTAVTSTAPSTIAPRPLLARSSTCARSSAAAPA